MQVQFLLSIEPMNFIVNCEYISMDYNKHKDRGMLTRRPTILGVNDV